MSESPLAVSPVILPPSEYDRFEQVTFTSDTSAAPALPLPLATLQVSPVGVVCTVTA